MVSPVIWAALIGTAVAMYVILDGFDLGVGILFPFARDEKERDQTINSIAPFWDGNETWLILGGGGLWVAFPQAYAVIMPAFYLPVIVMLLALVFRGVAFEFRGVARTSKYIWNFAFAGGSMLAAFCQGLILGGLIQGIHVENGAFAGGPFDWATPFSVLCGLGVVAGYALLGATWLVMKTEGAVAQRAREHAQVLLIAVLVFMAAVSLWTPVSFARIAARWFSVPNIYFLWPVPLVTALLAFSAWHWLRHGREVLALPRDNWIIPVRLSRSGDLVVSLSGAAVAHDLGHRRRAGEPDLHAGRHARAAPAHSGLYRVRLLAVPRQGTNGRRLPLKTRIAYPRCGCCRRGAEAVAAGPLLRGVRRLRLWRRLFRLRLWLRLRLRLRLDLRRWLRRGWLRLWLWRRFGDCTTRADHAPADAHQRQATLHRARETSAATSGTRSGKRALIAAGGAPVVSVVGHTTTAPLVSMSCLLTQGVRSGVASR